MPDSNPATRFHTSLSGLHTQNSADPSGQEKSTHNLNIQTISSLADMLPSLLSKSLRSLIKTSKNHNLQVFRRNASTQQVLGPLAARLQSRGVLRFEGPEAVKYLQGLLTNDLRGFQRPVEEMAEGCSVPTMNQPVAFGGPVYALLLTPQGRFLFDMFVYRPPRPEEKLSKNGSAPGDGHDQPALLADVDSQTLDELLSHLNKHRLRSKVEISDSSKDITVWQRFARNMVDENVDKDSEVQSIGWGAGVDTAGRAAAEGTLNSWQWFKDPRLASLGFRGLFPVDTVPPLVEADKEVDERHYLLKRLEEGVPEGPAEILKGEAIPLEYNMAALNAISFDKGCYVGQELIARTHHRGVIRKRIIPVTFISDSGDVVEQEVAARTEVIEPISGKVVGTVTTAIGSQGLALLRLEAALKSTNQLRLKGHDNIYVKVKRPNWWPSEWGHE